MKKCSICGDMKLLAEFSKAGGGRYAGFCKPCRNMREKIKRAKDPTYKQKAAARDKAWRERNPEAAARSDKKKSEKYKEANRKKINATAREYQRAKRKRDMDAYREEQRIYREANPEKFKEYRERDKEKRSARRKVHYALEKGEIERPSKCQCCLTEGPVQAHHPDYEKPLEISWLCIECHNMLHVSQRDRDLSI
jgi:hypothetical protein